jgi:hypothetical protein
LEEYFKHLLELYKYYVDVVHGLLIGLTRVAKYIRDVARKYPLHFFRLNQGVILLDSKPNLDFNIITYRFECRCEERIDLLYPGLDDLLGPHQSLDTSMRLEETPLLDLAGGSTYE